MRQIVALFLLAILLLQSCVAYQKTSVSLNEAANRGQGKLITVYDKQYYFKTITETDGQYYVDYNAQKIRIDSSSVAKIYLRDYPKSKELTVITVAGIVTITVAGLVVLIITAINQAGKDFQAWRRSI